MKRKQKLPRRFPQSRVTGGQTSLKHDLSEKSEVKRVKREQEETSCSNSELENSMLGEPPDSSQGQLLQGKENMKSFQTSQPASSSEEPEQKKSNKTIDKAIKTMDKSKHLMIKFKLDRSKNSWVIAHPEIEKGKSSGSSAPLQPRFSLHERQTSRNHEDIRAFERHVSYAGENFFSNENFGDMPYITKVFSLSNNFYEGNVGQKNMAKHGIFPECKIQQSGENCCKPFYPGSIDDSNEKYDGIGKISKHSEEAQLQSDYQITETWSHSNHTKPLMFYNKPSNIVSQMSTNVLTWDGNWLNKQSKLPEIDQHSTGSSLNTMNNPVTLPGHVYSPLLLISHNFAKEGLMVNGQLINQTGFSHLEALKSVETGNFTSNASVNPYLCKPLLSASILHNMKFKKTVSNDDDVKTKSLNSLDESASDVILDDFLPEFFKSQSKYNRLVCNSSLSTEAGVSSLDKSVSISLRPNRIYNTSSAMSENSGFVHDGGYGSNGIFSNCSSCLMVNDSSQSEPAEKCSTTITKKRLVVSDDQLSKKRLVVSDDQLSKKRLVVSDDQFLFSENNLICSEDDPVFYDSELNPFEESCTSPNDHSVYSNNQSMSPSVQINRREGELFCPSSVYNIELSKMLPHEDNLNFQKFFSYRDANVQRLKQKLAHYEATIVKLRANDRIAPLV